MSFTQINLRNVGKGIYNNPRGLVNKLNKICTYSKEIETYFDKLGDILDVEIEVQNLLELVRAVMKEAYLEVGTG